MKNSYTPGEAREYAIKYSSHAPELAMRVYTSRLIGSEADLVLHGGGNTSVKGFARNILGEEQEVLYIKGSGWDLASIEPEGFPALDLTYLRKLRQLDSLSDEDMVNQFRTHLLDADSPNPSIETLVHAFLPQKFIDHTHADAIVTLTNQEKGAHLMRDALGEKIAVLPFVMPGFPLAKKMAELYEGRPEIECIILMHHGIFTFAEEAETAYGRMIEYVSRAEKFIASRRARKKSATRAVSAPEPCVVLPSLRGALFRNDDGNRRHFSMHLRQSEVVLEALSRSDAVTIFASGVLTPDHVIRTKNYPLWLSISERDPEAVVTEKIDAAMKEYVARYDAYFDRQTTGRKLFRTRLDPLPRVMLIPGLGIVAAGKTPKDATIAADIAEHTIIAKNNGTALGAYRELDENSIFDMEYWSLEQAKLKKSKPRLLEGRSALVTGGGGAIAAGIGRQLLKAGARVFLTDINMERLQRVCELLQAEGHGKLVSPVVMDVSDPASVAAGFSTMVRACGGLDILVPNAGVAHVAPLADLSEEKFRQVLDVNLLGVFQVIKAAIPLFRRQGMGGSIIINSSKNVFDPGASFGAYSASKAGAHQLGKIAALELAELGVRVNMINADAIFSDTSIASGLWDVVGPDRMRSRNLDPAGLQEYYRQRNLLKASVSADHVGNAVVFFASEQTPTTGATLPVDGGIPAAFPR